MSIDGSKILLLGGPDCGKTTLVVQLHGRMKKGRGTLRAAGVPESLVPIEAGLNRLEQGLRVQHTSSGTDVELSLPAETLDGRQIDVLIPDYAGEDLRHVLVSRSLPDRWRDHTAAADEWLLLVRLSLYPQLPDILTRPIGELARSSMASLEGDADALPIDMWSVELLQALLYLRGDDSSRRNTPRFTLVLSCWDELDGTEQELTPPQLAAQRLALLDAFCRSTWAPDAYRVVGLSSQGRQLDDKKPDDDFLDHGPQQMGWIITPDGQRSDDLTLLIADG